jgi:hypothetical protein
MLDTVQNNAININFLSILAQFYMLLLRCCVVDEAAISIREAFGCLTIFYGYLLQHIGW